MFRNIIIIITLIVLTSVLTSCNKKPELIEVESLYELSKYLNQDSLTVKLKPGTYTISNKELSETIVLKKYKNEKPEIDYPISTLLHFSGNNSKYILNDVVITIDTELHKVFGRNHIFEVFVSGNNNTIEGLKVQNKGNKAPVKGAIMMHVMGDDNTIINADLFIEGSYPYGYGHLLGKGGNPIVKPQKHSSLLVSGKNTKLIGCKVVTHAFGHGIVMQGAYNTLIKDCYVEGQMRETNDMLIETSGPAFNVGFKSDYPPGKITPNEIKALSEDGVRSYSYGYLVGRKTENITVINTTVKNMRSGFDLSAHIGKTLIDGCTSVGCQEKGYSVSKNAIIKNSKGDAKYGPLLSFHGNKTKNCNVELELMPTVGDFHIKRLAEINGTGHQITLKNYKNKPRKQTDTIVFGESFWSDVHKYRHPEKALDSFSGAYNIKLINQTGMLVVFKEFSTKNEVTSNGELLNDLGKDNIFKRLKTE